MKKGTGSPINTAFKGVVVEQANFFKELKKKTFQAIIGERKHFLEIYKIQVDEIIMP